MNKGNLNELTGGDWLKNSFSIWRDINKTPEEKALKHPAMFPSQLASRIIEIYTKKKAVVLDPFMGVGSTVISAFEKNRIGVGFEISKEFVVITKERLKHRVKTTNDHSAVKIYNTDAREMLDSLKLNSVDLCLTSPPYWDILNMRRTADGKQSKNYGNLDKDLGNISEYERFLNELMGIFENVKAVLKNGAHCIIVVMDIRKKDKFYPLHSDIADRMKKIGFGFEDIIIWDRQHEYNNMRPLGYPFVFRVNKVHEYILIFKKLI